MEAVQLRRARQVVGLTQAEAARLAGTAQSALSAYESGSKVPTDDVLARILSAIGFRPSLLIEPNREQIVAVARKHHADHVRVFGSAARGEDTPLSDLDLLVRFAPGSSLFDLVDLADELEELLGVHVDVVSEGGLTDRDVEIRRDAVPV